VVPWTKHYARYYLLEWRNATKYDRMVRTAYVTTYYDGDEWRVERVPYNIPGALLYFRNQKYNNTYSLLDNNADPPSYGPKYQLLVVDMNYQALRLGDTGLVLGPRSGSYDAALTLQKAEAWSVSQVWYSDSVVAGPFAFPEKAAVTRFNDGYGYYAGYYAGAPCADGEFCLANPVGSAVIPASGDYTTRVTRYDGTPYPDYYGVVLGDTVLGTGNPKDSGVEYGVKLKLLGKSLNNTRGILQLN
jgi:immune inhibitor A